MADVFLEEVWSGGQIGADIAGLRAALAVGLKTGGWIPRGFRTHDGQRPEYAALYGLSETETSSYPARTKANVRETTATFILGDNPESSGCTLTRHTCELHSRPYLTVTTAEMNEGGSDKAAVRWLLEHGVRRLNVAGNRNAPEDLVERWLRNVFHLAIGD